MRQMVYSKDFNIVDFLERKRSSSAGLLPKGCKNSLTFGSHAGAKVSVIYHMFIETCKMCGISTLEYFKELKNNKV